VKPSFPVRWNFRAAGYGRELTIGHQTPQPWLEKERVRLETKLETATGFSGFRGEKRLT
jgi:hypothetical protein